MRICIFLAAALGAGHAAGAQSCIDAPAPVVMIGSRLDQSIRDSALLGRCSPSLIRAPTSLSPRGDTAMRWTILSPVIVSVWNSTIPVSANTGALWAGRGFSVGITGGVSVTSRRFRLILAPELDWSANRGFPILASPDTTRSAFASPWYNVPISADLPIRFGASPFATVTGGQTSVEVSATAIGFGFATENQWWGPGIRNALVMSDNAAGIPHVFVRTIRPVRTPVGDFEGRFLIGQLSSSRFFLKNAPSYRSLSAAVVTLRVPFDTGLTVGAARAVYGPVNGVLGVPKHWSDVFWRWNQTARFSQSNRALNQIMSVFAQWRIPGEGFEAYGEWARLSPPSITELLVQPQTGQGFTVGLQSLRGLTVNTRLRVQAEATMLEQTPPKRAEPVPSFYTSNRVLAGYTQRGQVIGASLGPGGSSQFLAADVVRPGWTAGAEVGRIQWNDEAYYQQATGLSYKHHDVSLFAGARGGADIGGMSIAGEVILTDRMNFLFQGADVTAFDDFFDVTNLTVKMVIGRAAPRVTSPARIR